MAFGPHREPPDVSASGGSRTSSDGDPIGGSRPCFVEPVAPFLGPTEPASRRSGRTYSSERTGPKGPAVTPLVHRSASPIPWCPQSHRSGIADRYRRKRNAYCIIAPLRARFRRGMSGRSPHLARPRMVA